MFYDFVLNYIENVKLNHLDFSLKQSLRGSHKRMSYHVPTYVICLEEKSIEMPTESQEVTLLNVLGS